MYVQIRSRHVAVYVLKHALHTRDQRFDDDDVELASCYANESECRSDVQ
jgi:hypothetical protein